MTEIKGSIKIDRAPASVARIMFDPKNDTKWIDGAKKVEPFEGLATTIGTRVKRRGAFLGSNFTWTAETVAFEPDRLLVFKYVEGVLTGKTFYELVADGAGTMVTMRTEGATVSIPGTATLLKRTVQSDLARLKKLVERQAK